MKPVDFSLSTRVTAPLSSTHSFQLLITRGGWSSATIACVDALGTIVVLPRTRTGGDPSPGSRTYIDVDDVSRDGSPGEVMDVAVDAVRGAGGADAGSTGAGFAAHPASRAIRDRRVMGADTATARTRSVREILHRTRMHDSSLNVHTAATHVRAD